MNHLPRGGSIDLLNPFRSPRWRADRVDELVLAPDGPLPCRRADDAFVRRYKQYRYRSMTAPDPAVAAAEYPECAAAERLQAADVPPLLATVVEARILARQSFANIAARTGLDPVAVEWYEALFFHVTDRLDARDWVVTQILIPALARPRAAGPGGFDLGAVAAPAADGTLKLFAYFCGPLMVDVLTAGVTDVRSLKSPEEVDEWFHDHWQRTIARRSAQAAQLFEINRFNVTELFAIHARIIEQRNSPGAARKTQTDMEQRLQMLLDAIPWTLAEGGGGPDLPGRLNEFRHTAAALNEDELMILGAGGTLQNEDEIRSLHLPPPAPRDGNA
ncbi:hypothetical protein [Fimbriiglobus ruber]|uniref:Uncharacterized protein n=1 Tax=Fimbriiglobus ruber TaxID=1908690 RepID=A0A225DG04_9BACT|nr:hypothetical protein [Fimbriiglobus ruber]OWK37438.1 hypothetical protein FRUB_06558 [Fimbriiglobus ruber]